MEARTLSEMVGRRVYSVTKTPGSRRKVFQEIFATAQRRYGRVSAAWILGRAEFICSGDPSFFTPPKLNPRTYRRALFDLVRFNVRNPLFLLGELTRGHGREWLRGWAGGREVVNERSSGDAAQ